ncbi:MAG: HNH endonuclease [Planctomycetaceae bacterium]|nr:HNH endonuclease [Planctomycetaceae bacterium]
MQDAYVEFRKRLAAGMFPKFRLDKPLSKFVIFARDGCKCLYCEMMPELSREVHLDHIVPSSVGGSSTAGNVATVCASCNAKKGSRRGADEKKYLIEISKRNKTCGICDEHDIDFPGRRFQK